VTSKPNKSYMQLATCWEKVASSNPW